MAMIKCGLEIRAAALPQWRPGVGIYLMNFGTDGQRTVAKSIEWVPASAVGVAPDVEPLALFDERAQLLMDDLWQAGVRPTQGRQSEQAGAALERHLADMRAIAFDRLKIAAP